jgi:hypothetical protein
VVCHDVCVCVCGLIEKLFFSRNESCKAVLCWGLASDMTWLLIFCTTWWTDTSYCCHILIVSSGLNFFILLCFFSFHVRPDTPFSFNFLSSLNRKSCFTVGCHTPRKWYIRFCMPGNVSMLLLSYLNNTDSKKRQV